MSARTTLQRWMAILGGFFLAGEVVLATQAGWFALVGGVANAALLVAGVGALVRRSDRRLEGSVDQLVKVIVQISKGDYDATVEPPTAPEVATLASAVEHARRRTAKQFDELLRAKQRLADELAQARELLRDPEVERRRESLVPLNLGVQVEVAGVRGEGTLVDFWLEHAEVALDRTFAKQLVSGQPVSLRVTSPDGSTLVLDALAARPTKARQGSRLVWAFSWTTPLAPADLWRPLWQAVNPRREIRVRPPQDPPLRAILHVDEASFSGRVLDLSKGGVGLWVPQSMEELGLMGQGAVASLTLEMPDDQTVRDRVWVRGVDCRDEGTKLGLALEGLDPRASQALAAWVAAARPEPEADDVPVDFVS